MLGKKTIIVITILIALLGLTILLLPDSDITGKAIEPSEKELFRLKFSDNVREDDVTIKESKKKSIK